MSVVVKRFVAIHRAKSGVKKKNAWFIVEQCGLLDMVMKDECNTNIIPKA
jgi:hypothetical protein